MQIKGTCTIVDVLMILFEWYHSLFQSGESYIGFNRIAICGGFP